MSKYKYNDIILEIKGRIGIIKVPTRCNGAVSRRSLDAQYNYSSIDPKLSIRSAAI